MSDAKIILDTNIVSYLMKGGPLAEAYAPHVQGKLLTIAFITVGEMYFGAQNRNWGEKRRKELETTLRNFVVIPYDH
jgi:predicted nucleic acid-binding protein